MDATESAFYDRVFQILRNFIEYGNYNSKQENAVKALIKSFPERPQEELRKLFDNCCKAYMEAIPMIKENLSHYSKPNDSNIPPAERYFRKKYANIDEEMLTWIIGWIYHWHHER